MRLVLAVLALALVSCDDGDQISRPPPIAGSGNPEMMVEIGPWAVAMPRHPEKVAEGFAFDFPLDGGSANYVTKAGSLKGKAGLRLRYRIEADPGVIIAPKDHSGLPSQLALYFQRCGDDLSGTGKFEAYRWYSTTRHIPITAGEHELSVSFTDGWGAVQTSTSVSNAAAFRAAIADTCRFGFVMGGGNTGVGHGVYATGQARMIVTELEAL